jgi:tRNA (mo5U34)-methyltransferase
MESSNRQWYHTLDLPDGPTAGEYDLRSTTDKVPMPTSLAGLRCLDVGTHDGFWAFEMERRGAAEVVAIDVENLEDLDWPEPRPAFAPSERDSLAQRKANFFHARTALQSRVEHRYRSVYDLQEQEIGSFDLVNVGSLLQHLRDPVGALMAVRRVTRGHLLLNAAISLPHTLTHPKMPVVVLSELEGPYWQTPNRAGLLQQVRSAGFEVLEVGPRYAQPRGAGAPHSSVRRSGRPLYLLPHLLTLRRGVPHIGILARPRP